MANAVIRALLIAQFGTLCFLFSDVAYFGRRAPRSPWGEGFKETGSCACCCHTTLPVVRPEDVEACQCEGGVANMGFEILG